MTKSCLTCLNGNFHQELDHHLYSYAGECEHWEEVIARQVLSAIEVNSEDLEEIERLFERIGEQCPAWEVRV